MVEFLLQRKKKTKLKKCHCCFHCDHF